MSSEMILTIDLYSNMSLANRLSVFLIETERPDKSRKLDLVKKFGQKEVVTTTANQGHHETAKAVTVPQVASENHLDTHASPSTPNREAGGQRNAMTSRKTKYFPCLVYSPLLLFHLL